MGNKAVIIGSIVIFIIVVGFFIFNDSDSTVDAIKNPQTSAFTAGETKEFVIIARQWQFSPDKIEVNQGDTVILNVKSIDVSHGLAIPKLGINEFLSPGNTVKIEFVAHQKGTFVFACSVSCGAGHVGMRGKIIVN